MTVPRVPPHILSLLELEIHPHEQQHLAAGVIEHGNMLTLRHVGKDGWLSLPVRRPVDPALNANNYRMVAGIEYQWVDTPITEMAKGVVKRVEHLFETVTRVTVLLQRPGATIAMHRDPVFGHDYGKGPHRGDLGIPTHLAHGHNGFMSLKAPVTERVGDNGCPIIRITDDGPDLRYDVGNHFFLINEIYALHGARPCEHHRGVLWIDGWFNRPRIANITRLEPSLTPMEGKTHTLETEWHA